MYEKWIPSIEIDHVQVNEIIRYQIPKEDTSIHFTNIN